MIFTVQDVLSDPPFSRIDLVSCRNLLIYLRPDAQAKVISLFHFALREGGILLLGSSETAGDIEGVFEVISKPERLYRHIGRSRSGEPGRVPDFGRTVVRSGSGGRHRARKCWRSYAAGWCSIRTHRPPCWSIASWSACFLWGRSIAIFGSRRAVPRMICWRWRTRTFRTKLRSAILQANQANARTVVAGGRTSHDGKPIAFSIDIQPVTSEGEALLLICFVDESAPGAGERPAGRTAATSPDAATLEQELEATRAELRGAVRALEVSSDEQRAINEEALSVQEEFQSTNEELLTSKEELQSLNEELTALNSQLQETLEKQRTTANDLQNVPVQHRCRDDLSRRQSEDPLLHARHAIVVQRHSRRHRPAARGSQFIGGR